MTLRFARRALASIFVPFVVAVTLGACGESEEKTESDAGTTGDAAASDARGNDAQVSSDARSGGDAKLPGEGATGCAVGGRSCQDGLRCCTGQPYPGTGSCEVECLR